MRPTKNDYRLVSASLALGLLLAVGASAAPPAGGPAKDVFTRGLPQYLAFRGEMVRASHGSYAAWVDSVGGASGVIRKFTREELPGIYPQSLEWARRYGDENPNALMMLHLNGESRQVLDFPEVHRRYFAGHWVYQPGARLVADVSADERVLRLSDVSPFRMEGYLNRGRDGSRSWFPQHLVIVETDAQGNRLWSDAEYAILEAVDQARGTITVRRGEIHSTPRPRRGGQAYVAPLAGGVWGGKPMWYYNLSSACPRDARGKTAGEVFAEEIASWFAAEGPLADFDGVAFDVNYFYARDASWDVDNDGRSDGGIVGGRNVWREGDWGFLKDLRARLGDNRLITADGEHPENQRAVGILDGIESEGLVQHNDGFRGFSRTVNTHLYWTANNNRQHDLRYVVLKLMNPADERRGDQLRRFATATACCLGALVTGTDGPFLPHGFAAPGALGRPAGELVRAARHSDDLLGGIGETAGEQLLRRLNIERGNVVVSERGLVAEPAQSAPTANTSITLQGLDVPPGDLTIFAEMEAIDPLEGFATEDRVPRLVRARFSSLPDYGEGRYNVYYANLYGYMGTHGRSLLSFYVRRPGLGRETIDVTLEIEGGGRFALHSLAAHSAADVLVRAFDRGVVAVNPAFEPVSVPLADLLPGVTGVPATLTVPALDAAFEKRGHH